MDEDPLDVSSLQKVVTITDNHHRLTKGDSSKNNQHPTQLAPPPVNIITTNHGVSSLPKNKSRGYGAITGST